MKYALLLACPLLLAAAQPAPPARPAPTRPAPAAGTAGRDAQCAIVLGTGLAILQRNTASPPPAETMARMREATSFYLGRLAVRYPAGRIGPALTAARATLPPRGPAWQPITSQCGLEFSTLTRAITAEVTPVLNQ
ncbi:MAG TPA: hypothetical protein VEC11_01105 [Allosphingosinicella sp.]|nr:hypothetical protein [Allosphingosinicella sp.]